MRTHIVVCGHVTDDESCRPNSAMRAWRMARESEGAREGKRESEKERDKEKEREGGKEGEREGERGRERESAPYGLMQYRLL
jgi:hypothetical protein